MMQDTFNIITQLLKKRVSELNTVQSSQIINSITSSPSIQFTQMNCTPVSAQNSYDYTYFLDGGNAPLLKSNALHIDYQKIAFSCYKEQKKEWICEVSYYVVAFSSTQTFLQPKLHAILDEIHLYQQSTKPSQDSFREEMYSFCSKIISDVNGDDFFELMNHSDIQITGLAQYTQLFRAYLEQRIAISLGSTDASKRGGKRLIVVDGALLTPLSLFAPFRVSTDEHTDFCGVAKTTDLLSDTGEPALYAARRYIQNTHKAKGCYSLFPLFEVILSYPTVGIAQLNSHTDHLFRVDSLLNNSVIFPDVIGHLVSYANDPIFLGYPYPLIEVDKHARVTNNVIEQVRTRLLLELQKNGLDDIISFELSSNAHSILDSLEF